MGMNRGDLTEKEWKRLEGHLPAPAKVGRKPKDHRRMINGMLWILRTGAPWRDLPERYGPWGSVSSRFYRWRAAGIWDSIWAALLSEADDHGALDWETHYVDGTIVRAHQHAAGAKASTAEAEALGRSQGGFSTKIHLRAEGAGQPVTFIITPGQQHEATVFEALMEQGAVTQRRTGRRRLRPKRVVGDKGYSSGKHRRYLRRRGIRYTIPRKRNERRTGPFDRAIYRTRNLVERLINRLKQFRRLATRYEKRAINFAAMLTIAAIRLWL